MIFSLTIRPPIRLELRLISFIFTVFFSVAESMAQPPTGVWVSSHELRVGTYFDLQVEVEDQRMLGLMREYLSEDSVYTEGGFVLVIDSSGTVSLLEDIRSGIQEAAYPMENEKLIFKDDSFRVEVLTNSKLLLIQQYTDSIWYEEHFQKLPEPGLSIDKTIESLPGPGAHLQLTVSDTLDREYQLDFNDERRVIITGRKDGMPYTLSGTWHSRLFGNTLLFSFYDNHYQGMQLYFFYKDSVNALVGGTFNNATDMGYEPKQLRSILIETEMPGQTESIRNSVIGSWEAVNDPLFYDPAIEFGFLSYQSFEITFEPDGSFRLLKSGTVLKNGDSLPIEESTTGKWEVSPTGNYLVLMPPDGIPFYLTIEKITPQAMEVYYFMKTMSEFENYNVFENRKVELRRREL